MYQYLYNIFVALSQFASVLMGGDVDDSICQRLARAKKNGSTSKLVSISTKAINILMLFVLAERDHVENSIVGEKNTREIWNWG